MGKSDTATSPDRGKYTRLRTSPPDDNWSKDQFVAPKSEVPVREIKFAVVLCVGGLILLTIGVLIQLGHFSKEFHDRGIPMLVLGSLMFIPGFYHVRLAYYAYKGVRGYRYQDIPRFDE